MVHTTDIREQKWGMYDDIAEEMGMEKKML